MIKEGIKQGTSWLQPKDERLEGDEPQIEENPEAEEEEPRLAGRDGLDQGPAQLPAEAEEQARAEEEEKARRILEETELKSFRLALMVTMLGTSIATEAHQLKTMVIGS